MKKKRTDSGLPPIDLHFLQERILRILSLHGGDLDNIPVEHLIRAVGQTMPPEFGTRFSELRPHIKSVLFDLKASGVVGSLNDYLFLVRDEQLSLGCAARCGNIPVLEKLLAEGVDQLQRDQALIGAVIYNQVEAARALIKAGADVNARDKLFGRTAMMYVTPRTKSEITRLLAEAGGDLR